VNRETSIISLRQQAESYLAEGKLELAKECYLEAIALSPNQAELYHKLGEILSLQKSWQEAIDAYCQAVKINPNFSWAYHKLGEALTQLKCHREAVEAYKIAIKLNPEFPWSYRKLGEVSMELENWDEAILAYRRFIEIKPNLFIAYKNLGDALMKLSRWDEALAAFQKAVEIEPNSYWGNNNLGEVLVKVFRFEEALAALKKALEIKPNLYFAYHNLGDALSQLKKWDEAVAQYKKAIEINSNSYWSYHNLGEVLEEKGEFEKAAMAYCQALNLKPESLEPYDKLRKNLTESEVFDKIIIAYLAQKIELLGWEFLSKLGYNYDLITESNIKEAIADYDNAIKQLNSEKTYYKILSGLPLNPEFYLHLGNLLAEKKGLNEAIIIYTRGLQLEPNRDKIREKLEQQLSLKERFKRELLLSRKALELNRESFELYYNLGVALSQLQKWEEAADAYSQTIKLQPDRINAYNLLGEALEKRGLKEEAIAYYEKAIVLQPPRQRQLLTIPANQPIKVKFTDFHQTFSYHRPSVVTGLFDKYYNICVSDDPDFLFYSVYGNEHEKYDCTKIFTTVENRHNYLDYNGNQSRNGIRQIDFRECDFAISHYYLKEPRHYRMPLYFRIEGFEGMKQLKKNNNIEEIIKRKTKFCCFVYSNKTAVRRINFFKKLNEYKRVDSAGKVLNNMGFLAPRGQKFFEFLRQYKFIIAFENSSTPGYTTEKMFWPMRVRAIPIYWGNPWIDREFNSASFINCHEYASDEEVIARVIELDNNEELYREVLAEPYFKSNQIPESFQIKNIVNFFDKIFQIQR
jgi:tetratricopeptide (TPR) repeat protein